MINLDSIKLVNINKPARYVGNEVNEVIKDGSSKSNIVLCYPNLYEKAMSNYMVQLLYNNINLIDDVWCKRCFAPDTDFEEFLRYNKYNIYSLEDYRNIKESDMLLFVIDNENDMTNFLNMLDLAGISIEKEKRDKNTPEIGIFPVDGVNISPIAKYADYIFKYSSEKEAIQRLLLYINTKKHKNIDINNENIYELTSEYPSVKIADVENCPLPSIKINNPSILIDLQYMNDEKVIIDYVTKCIKARGINSVSFLNEDKISQYKFCEIIYKLKANIENIRISLKKVDFNQFETDVLDIILPCIDQSAIYFNVITCSEKLREKIKKGTDRSALIEKINRVFKNNRNSIKLDFNIGLPEETYEDIDDIFSVLDEILNIYSKNKAKDKFSMKVNMDYYIPSLDDISNFNINNVTKLETKIRYIKEKDYDDVIKIDIKDISMYITDVLLKNGDESVSNIVYDAYNFGARFNSDDKKYNKNAWEKAIFYNIEVVQKYSSIM